MSTFTRSVALIGVVVAAFTALLVAGGPAGARAVPYTDPAAVGSMTLCDVTGHALTHGDTRAKPFVWRAVGSHAAPEPYLGKGRTAALYGYQPINGVYPQQWNGEFLTAGAVYSNARHPMAAATTADGSLDQLLGDYPPKWDGLIQLRMFVGAPQRATLTQSYNAATIKVTGHTWRLLDGGRSGCSTGSAKSAELALAKVRKLKTPDEQQYSHPESVFGRSDGKHGSGGGATGSGNGATSGGGNADTDNAAQADGSGTHAAAKSSSGGSAATLWLIGVCLVVAISGGLFWWRQRSADTSS